MPRSWRLGAAVIWCALAGPSCERGLEYAVLIEAFASSPDVLSPGAEVAAQVQALESGEWSEEVAHTLEADDLGEGTIRVAVELSEPAQVLVRLLVRGPGGVWVATRCYTVAGVVHGRVMLYGPLDDVSDPDSDTWAATETCVPRASDGAGCEARCPPPVGGDCDPDDRDFHPGAPDPCGDGEDQDCDGEDNPCTDEDGDGSLACPEGVSVNCDCDDLRADVGPGIEESPQSDLCENGRDDDCDGADAVCDRDGDGTPRCVEDDQSTTCDCDDADPAVHPGASETPGGVCDGVDNNCNHQTDEDASCLGDDLDLDGSPADCDGAPGCTDDCNDCAPSMAPDGTERCGDRVDGDCTHGGTADGQPLPADADACDPDDADQDGSIGVEAGGTDCDDADPRRYPDAPDLCGDGIDQDCSGIDTSCADDADGDGYAAGEECYDDDATRAPWLEDGCNGLDDDCDGILDEDVDAGWGCIRSGEQWALVDFAGDIVHCGGCRQSCNAGCGGALCKADTCAGGQCLCGGEDRACDGGTGDFCCPEIGCRDLDTDVDHCGQCGAACSAAECNVATCVGGDCRSSPAPDGTACSSNLVCCGGECSGQCAPRDDESRVCGNCGTQTRTCSAGCSWGTWGDCTNEGTCTPGDSMTEPCGNCGTRSRTCRDDCTWPNWGACTGEGACSPDAVRQTNCGECGSQQEVCGDDCQWQDVGSCDNTPARSCNDDNPCTTDSCDSSGDCRHAACGGGTTCCGDLGCTECCGNDVSRCGDEPRCADWQCDGGSCTPDYESRGSDPENECNGHDCCNGTGSCANLQTNC